MQIRSNGAGNTLLAETAQLQNASADLSEKVQSALSVQHLLLDKRRSLMDERRRQLVLSRSLVASCRSLIAKEWRTASVAIFRARAESS